MGYNDKQLQILNSAEKLFSIKGYDGASVRDIAEEAGVNIAMISYYFGSKEKLMQAIFENRTSQLTEKVEALLKNEALTPFQKLEVVIDDYVDRITSKERFYKLMICEQMMEKNTVVSDLLNSLKRKNAELLERLLKDGEQKKAFKTGVDSLMLFNTLIGTVLQTFINKDYYKTHHHLESLSDDDFKQLLREKLTAHIKQLYKAILQYED